MKAIRSVSSMLIGSRLTAVMLIALVLCVSKSCIPVVLLLFRDSVYSAMTAGSIFAPFKRTGGTRRDCQTANTATTAATASPM
jgi:hypothetical protein